MKGSSKYIFNNIIIILMMLLVCLPCDLKREVKQTLDIPISLLEQSEKPNKAIVCLDFKKSENQKISVSYQKKYIPKTDFNFTSETFYTLKHRISSFSEYKISVSVPIYILHEQYLI